MNTMRRDNWDMTLIVAVLTKEFALLSSDRRITRTRDGQIIEQHDSDTKVFVLDRQYVVGYSGVARFGGERMEDWLAGKLASVSPVDRLNVLQAEMENAVHEFDTYHEVISFVGVGFRSNSFGPPIPHAWILSNALDVTTGEVAAQYLRAGVRRFDASLAAEGALVLHIGETPLRNDLRLFTARAKGHAFRTDGGVLDPFDLVEPLAELTIKTSGVHPTVGDVVQVTNLARPDRDENEGIVMWIGEIEPGDRVTSVLSTVHGPGASEVVPHHAFVGASGAIVTGAISQKGSLVELGPQIDPWLN